MIKTLSHIVGVSLLVATCSVYSMDVDDFLKSVDMDDLLETDTRLLNLHAQLSDPNAKTKMINDLDSFLAIGVSNTNNNTIMTEFTKQDQKAHITKKIPYDRPFLGVDSYIQKEIPNLRLQEGLKALQLCMAKQGVQLPDEITRVVIYKSLTPPPPPAPPESSRFIYDYVFKEPRGDRCREFLYSPSTSTCFEGMRVSCHINIMDQDQLLKN